MKKCILTIVNKEYVNFFKYFLDSYKQNSNLDLVVITLNFIYNDVSQEKITFIPYFDENIQEFENLGSNFYIKTFTDKYKYIAAVKSKIVNFSLNLNYDLFFYVDADCLLMKNFDGFFKKFNNELNGFPLCPNFYYEYMVYNGVGNPYGESGYNEKLCLENKLIEYLNIECSRTRYRNTFCYIYDRTCKKFFEEAIDITFHKNLFENREIYFPLLDETVFNVLFWKYKYKDSLNIFPCVDFYSVFNGDIEKFKLFRNKDKLALLHVKFYNTYFDANTLKDFKNIDSQKYILLNNSLNFNCFNNLFYNTKISDNNFHLDYSVLSNENLSVLCTSTKSYNCYQEPCAIKNSNTCYFISINRHKDEKIHLIFKDEQDNILYYIDEAFNS